MQIGKWKLRVRLSFDLEATCGHMGPSERRTLARELRNKAHQLEFSAMIIEMDNRPKPLPDRLPFATPHKAIRN
jgi:hypothetical protein